MTRWFHAQDPVNPRQIPLFQMVISNSWPTPYPPEQTSHDFQPQTAPKKRCAHLIQVLAHLPESEKDPGKKEEKIYCEKTGHVVLLSSKRLSKKGGKPCVCWGAPRALTAAGVRQVKRSRPAVVDTVPAGSRANAAPSSGCSHRANPLSTSMATTAAWPAAGSARFSAGLDHSGTLLGITAHVLVAWAQSRTSLHQISSCFCRVSCTGWRV